MSNNVIAGSPQGYFDTVESAGSGSRITAALGHVWQRTRQGAAGLPRIWILRLAAGLVIPAVLLGLWHLSAAHRWVSPLVLPPPLLVWNSFQEVWGDGTIQGHLAVSAGRVAKGFTIGAVAGLLTGVLIGLSATFRTYVRPTYLSVNQVNILGWIPLLILVFGIDETLKVVCIAWSTMLPVAINTAQGILGIPSKYFELARVYQLKRHEVLWRVALPATIPTLFTGIRTGIAAAWASLVIVELLASSEGIGYMVVWGRQLFQLDLVMVAIVVIGIIGLSLDLLLNLAERSLQRWQRSGF